METQLTRYEIKGLVKTVSQEDKIKYLLETGAFIPKWLLKKTIEEIDGLYEEVLTIRGL